MEPKKNKKHTHVTRASSGFTLIELLIIIAILAILGSLVYSSYNRVFNSVEAVSETSEAAFQKEVLIDHISLDGRGVAIWLETEGTPMRVVEEIWADRYTKASNGETTSLDGFKKVGKSHRIHINGPVTTGERVALWYIYSTKTIASGRTFTEVSRVEVRPLSRGRPE